MSRADERLMRRLRAAAILAGHKGLQEMMEAIGEPGLSYISIRRMTRDSERAPHAARVIARHCAERGERVPATWIMDGWEADPSESALLAQMAEIEGLVGRLSDVVIPLRSRQ